MNGGLVHKLLTENSLVILRLYEELHDKKNKILEEIANMQTQQGVYCFYNRHLRKKEQFKPN